MRFKILIALGLGFARVMLGQTDSPAPEDLRGQESRARREHDTHLQDIGEAARDIQKRSVAPATKAGALVQLDMHRCLTKGDLCRKLIHIYSDAAKGASRVADELDAKAASPSLGATLSTVDLRQQLASYEGRLQEIALKPNPRDVERVEADGLKYLRVETLEAIQIVEQAILVTGDREVYAAKARAMRAKETAFRMKATQAASETKTHNTVCQANLAMLGKLAEQDGTTKEVERWNILDSGLKPEAQGSPVVAGPNGRTYNEEKERLVKENSELRMLWSSPGLLQKRAIELQNLAVPTGSN